MLGAADVGTFEGFFAARYDGALRLAYGLTGDRGLAEEVVQEAFVALAARFSGVREPGAYLRVCIVNGVRAAARRRIREGAVIARSEEVWTPPHLVEFVSVLRRLPARQRAALVLRFYEELDDRQIAELLRCRRSTVRSLIHRGLTTLREELSNDL